MRKPVAAFVVSFVAVAAATAFSPLPVRAQQTSHPPEGAPVPITAAPNGDGTSGTTDANRAAAAEAEAQTRKIIADKEAYRAAVDKTVADYDARMELYRQQVAEQKAKAEAIRRANEARVALYQACVAGDKAACQRYKAQ